MAEENFLNKKLAYYFYTQINDFSADDKLHIKELFGKKEIPLIVYFIQENKTLKEKVGIIFNEQDPKCKDITDKLTNKGIIPSASDLDSRLFISIGKYLDTPEIIPHVDFEYENNGKKIYSVFVVHNSKVKTLEEYRNRGKEILRKIDSLYKNLFLRSLCIQLKRREN